MKFLRILTVLLLLFIMNYSQTFTINDKVSDSTYIHGTFSGSIVENGSCPDFYLTFYDSSYNPVKIYYDTLDPHIQNGTYSISVLRGAKGKMIVDRPGFIFEPPETVFTEYIPSDLYNIDFIITDTAKPKIDFIHIPDSLIINLTDTIKFKSIDNSTFTIQNIVYYQLNNNPWKGIDTTGELYDFQTYKVPIILNEIGICRIKILSIDIDSNITEDTSDYFTVIDTISPNLSITSPTGKEKWKVGTIHNITWNDSDNVDIISRAIYYTYNDTDWLKIDNTLGNSGTYSWIVPNPPSAQCKILINVYDECNNSASDTSDIFEIVDSTTPDTIPPSISILYPQQNEKIQKKTSYNIKWNASDNDTIIQTILTYSYDSLNWSPISILESNQDSLLWPIPDTNHICYIKIQVKDSSENTNDAISKFTIGDYIAPIINIITPTADSMITVGLSIIVKFNATDNENKITNYKIFLSTDSGSTYSLKKEQAWSGGIETASIPTNSSNISEKCLIKLQVTDTSNNSSYDTSDTFSIVSPVNIKNNINIPKKFEIKISKKNFMICMEKTAPINISIITLNGRTIFYKSEMLSAGYHIIPKNYAQGIYILRVKRSDKTITKKFFKWIND